MTALPSCAGCKDSTRPSEATVKDSVTVRPEVYWCQDTHNSWRCLGKYPRPDQFCHDLERRPKEAN